MARPRDKVFKHGRTGYDCYGCKCDICRKANTEHMNKQREKHVDKFRKYDRERYADNPEKYKTRVKLWAMNNPDAARTMDREYMRKRLKGDLNFRILQNLRHRIYDTVKKGKKSARTMELIGCSFEIFREHIQSKFKRGMTWDNYGEWHIDHIRPCASFDLADPEQQKICFNWTNLQPLWAMENYKKNSMWDGVYSRRAV